MKRCFALFALWVIVASPFFAQKKTDDRLSKSAIVLKQALDHGLPVSILDKADCVLIFPGVKKVAIGIGGSYGRGALVCRKGADYKGQWGAPAMYSLDAGSLGVQLGSSETDFVLVVMNQKGAEQILNGKTKLGADAAAAAGPTGAQAASFNAEAMNADVLTYSQTKGLFAGASLGGATMDTDKDANKLVYGKEIDAKTIIGGGGEVTPGAKPLVSLLDKTSPARK
jgi:SH3 domain-containing YSC84-like protein 1